MTENNLYFFTETCDKEEIISNIKVVNSGVPPTTTNCSTNPNININNNTNHKLFKHGTEIDKRGMLKADTYEELIDKVNTRLNKKYSPGKVKWVWKVQNIFNKCELEILDNGSMVMNYGPLFDELKFTIEKKATWLENKYKYTRLSYQDFESELYDITYKAIEYYFFWDGIETEFTLVETLELYWTTRMNSFIKSCLYTKKNSSWYKAISLADNFENLYPDTSPDLEQLYIGKETVTAMFNDSELNEKEKALLHVIHNDPSGSLRNWGIELGITHPQTVKRLFQSLQRKLMKYK